MPLCPPARAASLQFSAVYTKDVGPTGVTARAANSTVASATVKLELRSLIAPTCRANSLRNAGRLQEVGVRADTTLLSMRNTTLASLRRRSKPTASQPTPDRIARVLGVVGCIVAIFSLTVSGLVAYRNDVRNQESEHQDFIRDTYATYREMSRFQMQQPEVAHVFVRPGDYAGEVAQVKRAFAAAGPEDRARLSLSEEAFAFYLFTSFERLVYARESPASMRSPALDRFLDRQLRYYAQNLLSNPRLLYYWRDLRGCEYYDLSTQRKYLQLVPNLSRLASDPHGPFE